jgi:hypothetical protein
MPTSVTQPDTFVLTDTEAAQLQSCQLAQQQKVTGTTPVTRYGSIAVPIAMIASVAAVDQIWYAGQMPASLFVTLLLFFVAGMATQLIGFRLNLQASKRRMRERTRQVFEPRTVRYTEDGIEQSLPDQRALHLWRGIDRVEQASDLILIWAGNLLVSAIPVRAFPAQADAQNFLEMCRRRAGSTVAPASGSSTAT